MCNQFGIIRNRTTSYHPQSNGMVERFHRQLKTAIMAHESPIPWTITLPAVLLEVCSAVKERLGRSAAEMIYGTTLRLPGEFTKQYTVDANTDLENYSDKLRVAMSRLRLCPPRDTQQHNIFQFKEIATCTHVFLRRIAIAPPLTAPAADAVIDSTKSNHANIANREQISTDQTVRKTRVGRIIQTPARFVQMVHAIVAPNDIYGGPNRMHRINNVFKL